MESASEWSKWKKVRVMCSYGGRILRRPHSNRLFYGGGETRILSVEGRRLGSLSSFLSHLSHLLCLQQPFSLKYQLPHHPLDSLISLSSDEDLHIFLQELHRAAPTSRLRLFLFPHINTNVPHFPQLLPFQPTLLNPLPFPHLSPLYLLPIAPTTHLNSHATHTQHTHQTASFLCNPNHQQQMDAYPMPHQSQSKTTSFTTCGDELDNDLARLQIYKSQPPPPSLPSNYQTTMSDPLARLQLDNLMPQTQTLQ